MDDFARWTQQEKEKLVLMRYLMVIGRMTRARFVVVLYSSNRCFKVRVNDTHLPVSRARGTLPTSHVQCLFPSSR